jgi:hypothetical protein
MFEAYLQKEKLKKDENIIPDLNQKILGAAIAN